MHGQRHRWSWLELKRKPNEADFSPICSTMSGGKTRDAKALRKISENSLSRPPIPIFSKFQSGLMIVCRASLVFAFPGKTHKRVTFWTNLRLIFHFYISSASRDILLLGRTMTQKGFMEHEDEDVSSFYMLPSCGANGYKTIVEGPDDVYAATQRAEKSKLKTTLLFRKIKNIPTSVREEFSAFSKITWLLPTIRPVSICRTNQLQSLEHLDMSTHSLVIFFYT